MKMNQNTIQTLANQVETLVQQAGFIFYSEDKAKIEAQIEKRANEQIPSLISEEYPQLVEEIAFKYVMTQYVPEMMKDETVTDIIIHLQGKNDGEATRVKERKQEPFTFPIFKQKELLTFAQKLCAIFGKTINQNNGGEITRLLDGTTLTILSNYYKLKKHQKDQLFIGIRMTKPLRGIKKIEEIEYVEVENSRFLSKKYIGDKRTIASLVENGTLTDQAARFLKLVVQSHMNIIVSGGVGSGKTSILDALNDWFENWERTFYIENKREMNSNQHECLFYQTRSMEGNQLTTRDSILNVLRMQAWRVIVGEIQDEAMLDMLQVMNTGHDGSMATLYAPNVQQVVEVAENLILQGTYVYDIREYVKKAIGESLDLILHVKRLKDGKRVVSDIVQIEYNEEKNEIKQSLLFTLNERFELIRTTQPLAEKIIKKVKEYKLESYLKYVN